MPDTRRSALVERANYKEQARMVEQVAHVFGVEHVVRYERRRQGSQYLVAMHSGDRVGIVRLTTGSSYKLMFERPSDRVVIVDATLAVDAISPIADWLGADQACITEAWKLLDDLVCENSKEIAQPDGDEAVGFEVARAIGRMIEERPSDAATIISDQLRARDIVLSRGALDRIAHVVAERLTPFVASRLTGDFLEHVRPFHLSVTAMRLARRFEDRELIEVAYENRKREAERTRLHDELRAAVWDSLEGFPDVVRLDQDLYVDGAGGVFRDLDTSHPMAIRSTEGRRGDRIWGDTVGHWHRAFVIETRAQLVWALRTTHGARDMWGWHRMSALQRWIVSDSGVVETMAPGALEPYRTQEEMMSELRALRESGFMLEPRPALVAMVNDDGRAP